MALTTAFAKNGNRKEVPQSTVDGSVSYDQGFGDSYALPPEEGGKFIDRAQFNQLMYDTTSQVLANKAQLNSIFSGNKSPYLLQPSAVNITVGTGGNFTNLNDAFSYLKQINSKQINSISRITLLSNFSDNISLNAFPPCVINCNGFKLGNNLTIQRTPLIELINLKLDGQLYAIFCGTVIVNSGTTLGGGASGTPTFDASIVANSSNILISDEVTLNPSSSSFGIVSKGAAHVLLASPSTWTQRVGTSFVRVTGGGIVSADEGVDFSGVSITKTNIPANTLIYAGIVFGNVWG